MIGLHRKIHFSTGINIIMSDAGDLSKLSQAAGYVDSSDLSKLLQATGSNVTVIDVRNDDFEGGHIPGAINIPYGDEWNDDKFLEGVVSKVHTSDKVVFHCMKSQVRGPFCAKQFNAKLQSISSLETKPEV